MDHIGLNMKHRRRMYNSNSSGGGSVPVTLAVDATNAAGLTDAKGSALTYSRASACYFPDFEGVLRKAKNNEAPSAWLRRVEQLATNTSNFSGWTEANATVAASSVTDPDGGTGAYTYTTSATTVNALTRDISGVLYGKTYGASIYVKYNNNPWYRLVVRQTDADAARFWVNIQTGSIGTADAIGTATLVEAGVQSMGGGWYRISVCGYLTGTGTYTGAMTLLPVTGNASTTSVAGAACEVYHPLFEDLTGSSNKTPSEYIQSSVVYNAVAAGVRYYKSTKSTTNVDYFVSTVTPTELDTAKMYVPVEGALTNGYTQPRDLSHADWDVVVGITSRAVTATGADGKLNGCTLITEDTLNSLHWVADTKTYADNVNITNECMIAKSSTTPYAYVGVLQRDGVTYKRAYLNVSTGVLGTADTGVTATVEDVGNFWMLSATVSVGAGASNPVCGVGLASADNTPSYTGVSSTLIVDGATVGALNGPSSVILDTGGAARAVCVCSYTVGAPLSDSTKAFTVKAEHLRSRATASNRLWQLLIDGNNYLITWMVTGGHLIDLKVAGTSKTGLDYVFTPSHASREALVVRWKASGSASLFGAGAHRETQTWTPRIGTTTLSIGASSSAIRLRKLKVYNGALTDGSCNAEST